MDKLLLFIVSAAMLVGGAYSLVIAVLIIRKLIYGADLEAEPLPWTWPWRVIVGAMLVVVPLFAIAYGIGGLFGVACVVGLFVISVGLGMILVGLQES